jgi:energy-coupling factor transporter ATP-binding protein EcfA2
VIEADGFSLKLKERSVLEGISFSIGSGEALGIAGSMGSGKTSLLYSIKGIIPSLVGGKIGGKLRVNGKNGGSLRRDVGIVLQNPNDQIFSRTLQEEVEFGLRNGGMKGEKLKEKSGEALDFVGLLHRKDDDPFNLSQGQRQKLAIASVLAMEPEVILLDEPTASLDHYTSLEVYKALSELREAGKTIVVVDHDTDFLEPFADRFLLLDGGKQKAFGGKEAFLGGGIGKTGVKIPWKLRQAKA